MASRIIPARAGFTPPTARSAWRSADHPRSRGVYAHPDEAGWRAWGSSPLARGLRRRETHPTATGRIIPARAGFTPALPRRRTRRSAPLSEMDHPRSRGVYGVIVDRVHYSSGSSPLARGLHQSVPGLSAPTRIIPARAGFTRSAISSAEEQTDHPRSRGVYVMHRWGNYARIGSSPLARGLQH